MADFERKAGYGLVIALSLTAMIGTGMFFGPAVAASYAGNASLIAWALLALITVYVGACFAELSSIFPGAGGVYEYAKQSYGRFPSFIIGWIAWLVGSITPSLLVVASLDFLTPELSGPIKLGLAIVIIIILNTVALRGIEASTAMLLFFAAITIGVILAILGGSAAHVDPANYTPFFPPGFTPLAILAALFFIMETFFGWESATFMGGETRNPERVIPRSIMITTIIVAVLGVAFAGAILGFIPHERLVGYENPLSSVATILFGTGGARAVDVAIFLALLGSAAGGIVSSPRLILSLARDRLFIEQLSAIHPKHHTPYKAIYFQTVISIIVIFIAFGSYQSLLSLLVPLALLMYISTLIAVPILRHKAPDAKRFLRVPFGTIGPILVSLFYIAVITGWLLVVPNSTTLAINILIFIAFGIPIYILINLYYNPDFLIKTVNSSAWFNRLMERFIMPRKIRQDILDVFRNVQGKSILEFGSGVGSFTMHLIKAVGPEGRIYAVDLSEQNHRILARRLRKNHITNIALIHDEHFFSRVHPDVPSVDMVFSVGSLSYVQDLKRVLADMHARLPENGRICIVEYVDYFWCVIPNHPLFDDPEKLRALFREAGFSVRIKKEPGLFWRYLYIYGIKTDHDVPVI